MIRKEQCQYFLGVYKKCRLGQNGHHQNLQTVNAGEGMKKRESSYAVSGNVNACSLYGKQYGGSSKSWNRPAVWSSISLLSMYPENMKTVIRRDTCTPVFIAALFTTAKIWKQLKYLSSVE